MAATKAERMRRAKLLDYQRSLGVSQFVDPRPATEHISYLYAHPDGGMSTQAIADAAGVALSTISVFHTNPRPKMRRTTFDAIMAVEYEGVTTVRGAWTDPTGTIRRLHALYAIGMDSVRMANAMGITNHRVVWHYMSHKYVSARVAQDVKAMYGKLRWMDPRDLGVFQPVITRNINRSRVNRWAPPSAWDDESIDNPAAYPEWTGACGTPVGFALHRRHGIPTCDRCKEARAQVRQEKGNGAA